MYLQETRRIDTDKVRAMCIRNNYYTCGTNEEYDEMFRKCRSNGDVLMIASDILKHSDIKKLVHTYGFNEREVLTDICHGLINDCSYTCVEIKD